MVLWPTGCKTLDLSNFFYQGDPALCWHATCWCSNMQFSLLSCGKCIQTGDGLIRVNLLELRLPCLLIYHTCRTRCNKEGQGEKIDPQGCNKRFTALEQEKCQGRKRIIHVNSGPCTQLHLMHVASAPIGAFFWSHSVW